MNKHVVSVSAVILNQDKNVLLIQGPKRGWELPGGLVERDEKVLDALVREVREETNAEIRGVLYRGLFHNIVENTINLLFLAEYDGEEL
jgi:ADP-ribose pyrophosphatase YjhB (NUDIX family)